MKVDDDEDVGLSLTIGCTVIALKRPENLRGIIERFELVPRLHGGWGGSSSWGRVSLSIN